MKLKLHPLCQRAKNRIKEHGDVFTLIEMGTYKGISAIHVESLEKTWTCNGTSMKWGGWFTFEEVKVVEKITVRDEHMKSINESARSALKVLLDEAEARDYDPPVPGIVVAELEWIIANS